MRGAFLIRDLPGPERPRERLTRYGPDALATYELLAVVLGSGIQGESAILVAQRALHAFSGLKGLSQASIDELAALRGIGWARAVQIKAAFALGARSEDGDGQRTVIRGPADVAALVGPRLSRQAKERFLLLCLDARTAVKRISEISVGTLEESLVHPREVFREAIQSLASAVIVAHNHPSGDPSPSADDVTATRRLAEAGDIIGIRLLAHVITGAGGCYSFQEHGLVAGPRS